MNKIVLPFNFFLIIMIFSSCIPISSAATTITLPEAYLIENVAQHKQLTGLSCGPAALEILYDFWGVDIDQKAIADVARSSSIGTYTWDMVRAGHFSHLSEAQGMFFPYNAPTAGFPDRPLGYASFDHSSDKMWWTELKSLIASDIPVILLMKYAPEMDTGHYRVIVGYDEIQGIVYFIDPWDRDLGRVTNPDGTVTWTMVDFKDAWNYDKYGTLHPYWGMVMMPWSVNLHTTGPTTEGSKLKVTADIIYPCSQPFDCSSYPASDAYAEIILPSGMHLERGSSRINIRDLKAGGTASVSWIVHPDEDGAGSYIRVKAGGIVSGAVPEASWTGNGVSYPPYSYTDEIGGETSIRI